MAELSFPHEAPIPSLRIPAVPACVRACYLDVLGLVMLAFFGYLAYIHYNDTVMAMDVGIYRDIANRAVEMNAGLREHVESEYPPLATALFWIANQLTQGQDFAAAWLAVIVIASMCAWAYLRCFSARDAAIFAFVLPVSVLLLGHDMIFARFDIFVGLALMLAARTHAYRSYAESAAWLSLAVALKVVPVLAIPILVAATPRRHWLSLLIGMICAAVVGVTLSVGVLGYPGMMDNIRYVAEYHSGRPVQLESLWSGLSMLHAFALGRVIHTGYDHMSVINVDVTHHAIFLAKTLVFTGLGFILYRMYRARQCRDFGLLLDVMLLWALAVSPVLSPQYFTWVVPLTLLVLIGRFIERAPTPRGVFAIGFTILMAYLTKWIFPAHYDQLIGQQTLPMLMLNLRNVSLMILTYFLLTDAGLVKAVHHYVPTRMFAGIRRTFAADTALMIVALFILIGIRPMLVTSFREIGFVAQEKYESLERLPLARDVDAESIVVVTNIMVPKLGQHRFFRVRPDDCVDSIVVNGNVMPSALTNFCDGAGPGRIFDFGPYMQSGKNVVNITVRNTGGPIGLDMHASVTPLLLIAILAVAVVMLWYATQCYCFYCAFLATSVRAWNAEMVYTLIVSWIRSRLPAKIFSITSGAPQMELSI